MWPRNSRLRHRGCALIIGRLISSLVASRVSPAGHRFGSQTTQLDQKMTRSNLISRLTLIMAAQEARMSQSSPNLKQVVLGTEANFQLLRSVARMFSFRGPLLQGKRKTAAPRRVQLSLIPPLARRRRCGISRANSARGQHSSGPSSRQARRGENRRSFTNPSLVFRVPSLYLSNSSAWSI